MTTLTLDLSDEALAALRKSPDRFVSELRFAAAVQLYHQGHLSQEKAAEIAGMSRLAFLDELARRALDVFVVDFDDLDGEISTR
jgi:predicted HTH domain antitoxin